MQPTRSLIIVLILFLVLSIDFEFIQAQCEIPSITRVSGTHAPRGEICAGDLVFEDDFTRLDLRVWRHERTLGGGGNWEFQMYVNNRSNSFAENGTLFIKPTLLSEERGDNFLYSGTLDINGNAPVDECTDPRWYGCSRTGNRRHILNPIKSAKLTTVESFAFRYGKIEVKAKLPSGDWLWPAIWMLPRHNQYSSGIASGEIDLMESRGNKALLDETGKNIGVQLSSATLHWGPNNAVNQYLKSHFERTNDKGFDDDFNTYQLIWTDKRMDFCINNVVIGSVEPPDGGFWELGNFTESGFDNPWRGASRMAPFDQEFYIILNLAVGGNNGYFPDTANNPGGKAWNNTSQRAMSDFWEHRAQWLPTWDLQTDKSSFIIDYIHVYAI